MNTDTFVVTLKLDARSFERLDAMRREHFPAAHNRLPAHLTLLHRLDAVQVDRLLGLRPALSAAPPIPLEFASLRPTGRGVSVDVQSRDLGSLRREVVAAAAGELSRQDQQGFRPHVTVQNKVTPQQAKECMAELSKRFASWQGTGVALSIWRYLGGDWDLERELGFLS